MYSTTELKEYAQLSEAAYAFFDSSDFSLKGGGGQSLWRNLTEIPNQGASFSARQAEEFASQFDVLHQSDPANQGAGGDGFSATLFRDKNNEKIVLAFRGTEFKNDNIPDLLTDLRIGVDGYASIQAISEFRYIKQLMTVGGQSVGYSEDELNNLKNVYFDYTARTLDSELQWEAIETSIRADKGIDAGQGNHALIGNIDQLSLTGHSLGGHLAVLATRLFPSLAAVPVVTVNAPGFFSQSEIVFSGFGPRPELNNITHVESVGDGVSELGNYFPGTAFTVGMESSLNIEDTLNNHSVANVADGLRLTELFGKLDARYAADARLIRPLFDASSNLPINTYEHLFDSLRMTLLGPNQANVTVETAGNPATRNDLYVQMAALEASEEFKALTGKLTIQAFNIDDSKRARTVFSSLIALVNLSPFTVNGIDAEAQAKLDSMVAKEWTNSSLLKQWQDDAELTEDQRKTGEANFSDAYLADRAKFLGALIEANRIDSDMIPNSSKDGWIYKDQASNQTVALLPNDGSTPSLTNLISFGDFHADNLNGGTGSDSLYGGDGYDVLKGLAGNDYIEGNDGSDSIDGDEGNDQLLGGKDNDILRGGIGNDTLLGGIGNDLYDFRSGDGQDVIIDADGIGVIRVNGAELKEGKPVGGSRNIWKGKAGNADVTYLLLQEAQSQSLLITVGDESILVKNYQVGDLGLTLIGMTPLTPPQGETGVIHGDRKAWDANGSAEGEPSQVDQWGNVIVLPDQIEPGKRDFLYDTDQNDQIYGEAGDDYLQARQNSADLLDGGSGNDWVESSDSVGDTLIGGEGRDRVIGGNGNDHLYAEQVTYDYDDLINSAADGSAAELGDLLVAGAGQDLVIGSRNNDLIQGEGEDDILFGGDGNDFIVGDSSFVEDGLIASPRAFPDNFNELFKVKYNDQNVAIGLEWQAAMRLFAKPLNNYIAGNDTLFGGAGNDTLIGNEGDDILFGGHGADLLLGGDGKDTLMGDEGADFVAGNDGDDSIFTGEGNDIAWGGSGNDLIFGGDGNDLLYGDVYELTGSQDSDTIYGGAGNDKLFGNSGLDYLDGGVGNDTLFGMEGGDTLRGDEGDDRLFGDEGNDQLFGGLGADSINGSDDDDIIEGQEGNDLLCGDAGADHVSGGSGNDIVFGDNEVGYVAQAKHGNDYIDGNEGDDVLVGGGGKDTLIGGSDNDTLYGDGEGVVDALGADLLDGGSGNDELFGNSGDDTLIGGSGLDYLDGGDGADTYFFARGDSQQQVDVSATGIKRIHESVVDTSLNNTIEFASGISLDDVYLTKADSNSASQTDFILHYGADDAIFIKNGLAGAINSYKFADGTIISNAGLIALKSAEWLGANAPDSMVQMDGKEGNDTLRGIGNSPYVFFGRGGDDSLKGGAGSDLLSGGDGNDVLEGNEGADSLLGGIGDDFLDGGIGSDVLSGGEGNDVLQSLVGADSLEGGTGQDKYVVGLNSGIVTLTEVGNEQSYLKLVGDFYTSAYAASQVNGDLHIINRDGNDGLIVKGYFAANQNWQVEVNGVELAMPDFIKQLKESSPQSFDDAKKDFKGLVLQQDKKSYQDQGYLLQNGILTKVISDKYSRSEDTIKLGFSPLEINDGGYLNISSEFKQDIVEDLHWTDTTRETIAQIKTTYIFHVFGPTGEYQQGKYVPYSYYPSASEINSWGAGWTYESTVQEKFYVDVIRNQNFSKVITQSTVTHFDVKTNDQDHNIYLNAGNTLSAGIGNDVIQGVNSEQGNQGVFVNAGSGNDTISGTNAQDVLIGADGMDVLIGGEGSDTYFFSAGEVGTDYVIEAAKFETIYENGYEKKIPVVDHGIDSLQFASGVTFSDLAFSLSTLNLDAQSNAGIGYYGYERNVVAAQYVVEIVYGAEKIRVLLPLDTFTSGYGVEQLKFANGEVIDFKGIASNLIASASSLLVSGHVINDENVPLNLSGSNTYLGWAGNDTLSSAFADLSGGAGNDLLIAGDGNNVLVGGLGSDTMLGAGGNDTLGDSFADYLGDGNQYIGGAGNDSILGSLSSDQYVFNLGDGQDVIGDLYHNSGSYLKYEVWHYGGAAYAHELGMSDAEIASLEDSFNNYTGNETYLGEPIYKGLDSIIFGEGITSGDLYFNASGYDLVIGIKGTDDSITLQNWYLVAAKPLGSIVFSNGEEWSGDNLSGRFPSTPAGITQKVDNDLSYSQNIYGTRRDDVLIAGTASADWNPLQDNGESQYYNNLYGDAGNDIYEYSSDASNLKITETSGDDTLRLNGISYTDLSFAIHADQLVIGANNDSKAILIQHQAEGDGIEHIIFSDGKLVKSGSGYNLELFGSDASTRLNGLSGNDSISAGAGDDQIYGRDGDDTLIGGTGNDYLDGGNGGDTYIFRKGDGADTIADSNSSGANLLKFTDYNRTDISALIREAADLRINLQNGDSVLIAAYFDQLANYGDQELNEVQFANSEKIALQDLLSADGVQLSAGDDNFSFSNVINKVFGLAGNDVISGASQSDTLDGGTGDDTLYGNNGDDTLIGGTGNDYLAGGTGNDTYEVDSAGDVVVENSNAGVDLVNSSISYSLGANVENLTLTGTAAISGTGNVLDNILIGNAAVNTLIGAAGNDFLDGGAGKDTLIGGVGDDTYIVNIATDVVTELAGEGIDTVQSTVSWTLGANVENLILSGTAVSNGTGNALNNILIGNNNSNTLLGGAGNDTLDGGLGTDYMSGGTGNDTYIVSASTDVTTELADEGIDTVQSSVTRTLGANLENLELTGTSAIRGTGNELNNTLTGNSANNTLDGGLGNDTLLGGAGNDIYVVDSVSDSVIENADAGLDLVQASVSFDLSANVEDLTLTGTNAIDGIGNSLGNTLIGNAAANRLTGGAGNDVLNGGASGDTLLGGTGDDRYIVDDTMDVVTELHGEGLDTVESSVTWALGNEVENLRLTGAAAINGAGNSLDNLLIGNRAVNTLVGGAGNDTLNGGAGSDVLVGGSGDDTYVVDVYTDVVTELANEGVDTIQSSTNWTLTADIENLILTGSAGIKGNGNSLGNVITGNSGANIINANAGNDTLSGGGGNDTLNGGTGNDCYLFGRGDGIDSLTDSDATVGNADVLQLRSDVASNQLWFQHVGNNLEISIIGTGDKTVVQNWYSGSANRLEQIKSGDGKVLLDSQVDALVSAMAGFNPPAAGQISMNQQQQDALQPVLAANWH